MSNDDISDLMLNNFSPDWRHEDLSQLATHHHQSPAPPQSQSSSSQILGENSVRSRGVRGLEDLRVEAWHQIVRRRH